MGSPEGWRKKGRKASDTHWVGLEKGELIEIVVYNDQGQTQGTIVGELVRPHEDEKAEGQTWLVKIHACQGEYFGSWASTTYENGEAGVHICA